jgi:hypothetical protein
MKNEAAFIVEVMFDLHKANRKHVEKVGEGMAACKWLDQQGNEPVRLARQADITERPFEVRGGHVTGDGPLPISSEWARLPQLPNSQGV